MPRIGVEYDDLVEAAQELEQKGGNLTVETIRRQLGTGSNSTLAKHLKRYKEEIRTPQNVMDMPSHFSQQVQTLYQQLAESVEVKASNIALLSQTLLCYQSEETTMLRRNNRRWQDLYGKWVAEKAKLTSQIDSLIAEQIVKENNIQALKIERDLLAEKSSEQKYHIESIERQLIHAQHNLEHFRESARAQHLEEQTKYNKLFDVIDRLRAESKSIAQLVSITEQSLSNTSSVGSLLRNVAASQKRIEKDACGDNSNIDRLKTLVEKLFIKNEKKINLKNISDNIFEQYIAAGNLDIPNGAKVSRIEIAELDNAYYQFPAFEPWKLFLTMAKEAEACAAEACTQFICTPLAHRSADKKPKKIYILSTPNMADTLRYYQAIMTAYVFSSCALEAYINMRIDSFKLTAPDIAALEQLIKETQEGTIINFKQDIMRTSIESKLFHILPYFSKVFGVDLGGITGFKADFKVLTYVRNYLVHLNRMKIRSGMKADGTFKVSKFWNSLIPEIKKGNVNTLRFYPAQKVAKIIEYIEQAGSSE